MQVLPPTSNAASSDTGDADSIVDADSPGTPALTIRTFGCAYFNCQSYFLICKIVFVRSLRMRRAYVMTVMPTMKCTSGDSMAL